MKILGKLNPQRARPLLSLLLLLGFVLVDLFAAAAPAAQAQSPSCDLVTLHYRRSQGDYEGWGLHVWGTTPEETAWETPLTPDGEDDFGVFWEVEINPDATFLNYILHNGDAKDPGPDQSLVFAEKSCEVWQVEGMGDPFTSPEEALAALEPDLSPAPVAGENQVILHYRRNNGDYTGWGLHVWGPTTEQVTWTTPLLPAGEDDYGIFWVVNMEPSAASLNYLIHKGDEKDPGPDQTLDIASKGNEIFLVQGSAEQFTDPEEAKQALIVAGVGDITNKAQAFWLSREIIAWPVQFGSKAVFTLHYAADGAVTVTQQGLEGGQSAQLEFLDDNLPADLTDRYPHLVGAVMLKIPDALVEQVPEILRGQFAVSVTAPDGQILGATSLQIAGVLDDLYTYDGPLGVTWEDGNPVLRVWAPTARQVSLVRYPDSSAEMIGTPTAMEFDPQSGVWSLAGSPDWKGQFYLYQVDVYHRPTGEVVTNLVTDPYSLSLATNSTRSQIVDLRDAELSPDGWAELAKPPLEKPEDIVIYELHMRDFSAQDETVPAEARGTFMAFTHAGSAGMQHLQRLAAAGLTHLHLLPVFDFATINETKAEWAQVDFETLRAFAPDSEQQQASLSEMRGLDAFNWGYDPFHYTVPEGSYATDPDGTRRIYEFRAMVQGINQSGLRVVMDVVYNHTNAAGLSEKSVLDKIVPGYYHRLDMNGNLTTSTCCPNTASENAMMEKLMVDSVVTWAREYKVDGFRFDLMGHHMRRNMEAVRAALDALTLETDGVDGKSIYVYGEGWDFGEVAGNARGINATQLNIPGTGIGTFNDRVRDAVRGGGPFDGVQEQGFATGLYFEPNDSDHLPEKTRLDLLLSLTDQIRVSLAGNLADYPLIDYSGTPVTGNMVGYNGAPTGYTQDPQENIVYVSAHDNESLFDAIQYKAPLSATKEDRVRMNNLALDIVAFSQGIPFFTAGSELLHSKSFDRDSYDSTDWFNWIDFTYQSNNWGIGLPPKDKNEGHWALMQPLLANPDLAVGPEHIQSSLAHFEEILRIRKSSALFRLPTKEAVIEQLRFLNMGSEQIPGLIVMNIRDAEAAPLDPSYAQVFVLFNASPEQVRFSAPDVAGETLQLHPIQAASSDAVLAEAAFESSRGAFTVPGRTTAVFVQPRAEVAEEPVQQTAQPGAEGSPTAEVTPTAVTQPTPTAPPAAGSSSWPIVVGAAAVAGIIGGAILLRRKR